MTPAALSSGCTLAGLVLERVLGRGAMGVVWLGVEEGRAPLPEGDRVNYARIVSGIRAKLGERAFADSLDQGRALTLVQAVEESQGDAGRALSIEDAVSSILRIA